MNSSCNRKSCSMCEPLFSKCPCWTLACWPGQQCLRNAGWHSCHRGLFSFWTALQEWLSSHIVLAGGQETSSGKCRMGGVWITLLRVLTGERSVFFTKHSFLYCFLGRWVTSGHATLQLYTLPLAKVLFYVTRHQVTWNISKREKPWLFSCNRLEEFSSLINKSASASGVLLS